ncbi:glycosyltransferase family 2 protein [Ponticaulis sp.]|uniref:glycosyltransferase family 2 protein n=1 Tax=Ponticaulis sp. TaxID=2020902 RepID=UPI0025D0ED5E|nr:glycosyltransferase family 2 protein [Ponticaulis sp.]
MTSAQSFKVSALVVTFHSGPALKECINALCVEQAVSEIIVVNNGNSEADVNWLKAFNPPGHCAYKLVDGHGNIGFAAGVNLAAANATGDRFLVINPDAVLRVHSITRLEEARTSGPSPCLVGGKLIYPSGNEQRGARRELLTPWRAIVTFSGLFVLGNSIPAFRNMHRERDPEPENAIPMPVVSGALCYISKEDYEAVQGFDEGYFLHVEDIDFCRRIGEAGGQVIYTPKACALHYGSTSQVSATFVELNKARGLARYFHKNAKTPLGRLSARASFYAFAPLLVSRSFLIRRLMMARQALIDMTRPKTETPPPSRVRTEQDA